MNMLDPEDGYPLRASGFVPEIESRIGDRTGECGISGVAGAGVVGSKVSLQERHLRVDGALTLLALSLISLECEVREPSNLNCTGLRNMIVL